jgi:hypothetical protein
MSNDFRTALERWRDLADTDLLCPENPAVTDWAAVVAAITATRATLAQPEGETPGLVEIDEKDLLRVYCDARRAYCHDGPEHIDWQRDAERGATLAGLGAVLSRWGRPAAPPAPEDLATDQMMAANLSALLIKECGLHSPGSSAHDLLQRAAAMLVNYGLPAHSPTPPAPEVGEAPAAWLYKGDSDFDGTTWRENWDVTTDEQLARFKASPGCPVPLFRSAATLLQQQEVKITSLRSALADCGRAVGASVADDCSDDFLLQVPAKVRLTVAAPASAVVPVAVGEMLPSGTWWFFVPGNETDCPAWTSIELEHARAAVDAPFPITHLLPAHAIPLPRAREVGRG